MDSSISILLRSDDDNYQSCSLHFFPLPSPMLGPTGGAGYARKLSILGVSHRTAIRSSLFSLKEKQRYPPGLAVRFRSDAAIYRQLRTGTMAHHTLRIHPVWVRTPFQRRLCWAVTLGSLRFVLTLARLYIEPPQDRDCPKVTAGDPVCSGSSTPFPVLQNLLSPVV